MDEEYIKKPYPAYRGDEPYIFVSYEHNDLNSAYPEIKRLQDKGFNIFYDEDMKPTDNIVYENLQHIDNCALFIIFVTDNSVASKKAKKEFRYAITEGKSILAVYFDDFKNIEMNNIWTYELLDIRGLYKNNLDEESYMSQIADAFQNSIDKSGIGNEDTANIESDDPYICAIYDNSDFDLVFKEIRRLQNMDYDVRFNERFGPSENSLEQIGGCRILLFFVSNKSVESKAVKKEIKYAISNEKPVLPIYLEDLGERDIDSEIKLDGVYKASLEEKEYVSEISKQLLNFGFAPSDPTESKLVPGVGREPLPAYRGENPYAFVSYAHKDSNRVFPEIKRFQDFDYNIWYDEGIAPANEWLEDILNHLDDCVLFIIFITQNSLASVNVKKEIKYAIYKEKSILPIFLDDFDELKLSNEWKSILSDIQGILKTTMDDEEYTFKVTEAFKKFGFEQYIENIFEKVELKTPEDVFIDDAFKYDVLFSDMDSKSLSGYADYFFDNLVLYEDYHNGHCYKEILKSSIDLFLENKTFYNALDVFKIFFSIYQITPQEKNSDEELIYVDNTILDLVDVLIDSSEIYQNSMIHAVNAFILGLTVYSQNENYKQAFKSYIMKSDYEKFYKSDDGDLSNEEFLFRWGITSLCHDIYLSFEKNGKTANSIIYKKLDSILGKDRTIEYMDDLNELFKMDYDEDNPYYFTGSYIKRNPETKFLDLYEPSDIMAHRIAQNLEFSNEKFKSLKKNLNLFTQLINKNEYEEHGFLAALLVLNSFGYQIQTYRKDPDVFFYPIADSSVAIFLHNYYKYFLQREPFNLKQLNPHQCPLTYLLILCDNILEFNKRSEIIHDKKVNLLSDLQLDNEKFQASYIVKSSSYGFGFSNELLLDDILDTESIFKDGLSIKMDSSGINNNEISILSSELSNSLMENVEKLANQFRRQLIEAFDLEYDSSIHQSDDIKQAKRIFKELNTIGCEIAVKNDERESITEFSPEEVIDLARIDHQGWYEEKSNQGWTYGEFKDNQHLITPLLVSWEELPLETQQFQIDSIKNIPHLVESIGFKIVPSKSRLITEKIHEFFEGEDFNDLQYSIKKLNYKKFDLIIETLSKIDYFIVDKIKGSEIVSFDEKELLYLAQENHKEWYQLNNSLGWNYGENFDLNLKTNPQLVIWEKLSYEYAKMQVDIFKKLPEFCDEAGLTIIKNI